MTIDILCPTNKLISELNIIHDEIKNTRMSDGRIIFSCINASAAINRNFALNKSNTEIVIMLDDDITGFYNGWDLDLIKPLTEKNIMIVSSRLKCEDGSWMDTIGDIKDYESDIVQTKHNITPSACIAFKKTDIRFNENYKGAGFEDTSFCLRMFNKYKGKIVINNRCQLVHKNEKKHGKWFAYNREVFKKEFNLTHEEVYKYH